MAAGTRSPTRSSAVRRPRRLTLAAGWLAVSGVLGVLYAGIVPLLPPLVTTPVPLLGSAAGIAAIAGAIGVWRMVTWGRWLGVAALLFGIVQAAGYGLWRAASGPETGSTSPAPLLDLFVAIAPWVVDLVVLWVLLRRWPSATAGD